MCSTRSCLGFVENKKWSSEVPITYPDAVVFISLPLAKSTSRFIIMFVKNVCSHLSAGDFYKSIRPSTDNAGPVVSLGSHRCRLVINWELFVKNHSALVFRQLARARKLINMFETWILLCVRICPVPVSWQL